MRYVKKYRFLIFLVICFVLGFVSMPLFHGGYMEHIFRGFTKVPLYLHFLLFIGLYFLSLTLHELTHLFSFVFSGYKNDVIIILFLIFYKNNNKWKIKIDFRLLALGGGLVMPNLGRIESENDFNKAKKATLISLLAAPLFTLISGILLFLLTFIFFYKIPFLVPIAFYTLLLSLLFTLLSSKSTDQIYGDFKAYQKVKSDSAFALLIISQYTDDLTAYQRGKMELHIQNQNPIRTDMISASFFLILLYYALYETDEVDLLMVEKVSYFLKRPSSFNRFLNLRSQIELPQTIIFYLDRLNYKNEALKLMNSFLDFINNSKLNKKVKTYITKQTRHILKLSNESVFINDIKNMNTGFLSIILKNIPFYFQKEQQKNKGFEPLKLYCEIKND